MYNYATLLAALEKAGHNPELKNAKPATCTQDGYTGDEVCKVCGEVITKPGHPRHRSQDRTGGR